MDKTSPHSLSHSTVVHIAVVGVLTILALFLLAETIHVASNLGRASSPATDTITVQGSGEVTRAPDIARISFTVEHTNTTVALAQQETTKQTNDVLDRIGEFNLDEKDIKTTSYSIYPQYSYTSCPSNNPFCERTSKVTGYRVAQGVQLTVRDLDSVGKILGALGTLEVQNINGPSFGLEDSTAGYNAARAEAIKDAKKQARELARELGVDLGKVVSFSDYSNRAPYPVAYGAGIGGDMMATKESAPQVPVGENSYSASVSVTYEIR